MMSDKQEELEFDAKMIPIELNLEEAESLAEKLYGLIGMKIKELNAYDDKNYHVNVSGTANPYIRELWLHGYVLKILNSLDSKNVPFVEAQNELMIYLAGQGISTTQPVKTIEGKYYSFLELKTKKGETVNYIVRLLTFQPGLLLKDVPPSKTLFRGVGYFAGIMDLKMKQFNHNGFNSRRSDWSLYHVPKVKQYLHVLKDDKNIAVVSAILTEFEKNVVGKIGTFQKGLIHGDFNEQNILVKKANIGYEMCSILDFGDTHIAPYLFELSITMCYLMMHSQSLEDGRDIVAGYSTIVRLPEEELRLLKVCISGRVVQSLVMGLYFSSKDPTNQYILATQKSGWIFLHKLWNTDSEELHKLWCSGINDEIEM